MDVVRVTRLLILLATATACAATPLSGTGVAVNYTLRFLLITNTTAECVERLGSNVSVELSYRTPGGEWNSLRSFSRVPGDCNRVQNREEVQLPPSLVDDGGVQFRWLQRDQAWALCNCWQIDDVAIVLNDSIQCVSFSSFGADDGFTCTQYGASAGRLNCLENDDGLVFCGGSASVPRGVVTQMFQLSAEAVAVDMCTVRDLFEPIDDVQFCDGTEEPFIRVSFQLAINGDSDSNGVRSCDVIEFFDEGVELAVQRREDEQWVPLKFYTLSNLTMSRDVLIDIGSYDQNSSVLSLRGYNVSVVLHNTSVMNVTEYICDERFFREEVQFRWLQTVTRDSAPVRDTWFIDNVEISFHEKQDSFRIEFFDGFIDSTSINNTLWPQVWRGDLGGTGTDVGTACVPEDDVVLFFGASDEIVNVPVTRMAVLKALDLRQAVVPATTSVIIPAPSSVSGASSTAVLSSNIVPSLIGSDTVQSSPPISSATSTTVSTSPSPISSRSTTVSTTPPPSRSTAFSSTTVSTTPPPSRSTAVFSSATVPTSPLPIRSRLTSVSASPSPIDIRSTAVFSSTTTSISPLLTALFTTSIVVGSSTAFSSNIVSTSPSTVVFSSSVGPNSSFIPLTTLFSSADVLTPSIPLAVFISTTVPSLPISITSTVAFSSIAVPSSSPPVSSAAVLSASSITASFTVPNSSASTVSPSPTADMTNSSASTVSPSPTAGMTSTPTPTMPTPTSQAPSEAVQLLMDLFSINETEEVSPSEILSTLRDVLGNLSASVTFPPDVSEQLFNFVSDLIDTVQRNDNGDDTGAIGSTLLDVMDRFALGPYDPEQGELEDTENIALVHMVRNASTSDVVGIARNGSELVLPSEVFININRSEVPVASYYYRNMSGLLPDSLPSDSQNSTATMRLASPILSSALQCGSILCNTQDMKLENPVTLVFRHSPELVGDLKQRDGRESSVICVFFDFDDSSANGLISGQWATEGCTRNDTASNESHTVCECNHLTHFALLLSTTEVQLTRAEALSLRIIGIICVTISLICLTVTILTFLFLKSLWSMRNYIHINLCASLFVAQLTFIVAVEPHGSAVGCQVAAVLLHYFFLVTFMWMLMEGVVLYVALVRVFIKHKNRYLIAFTLASYGLPLLYLGVTVPLGFALQDANGPHYAGDVPQSCWLRYDTHFIWAFIAPVIVIILANIGFFIMAIIIMYRHQRRQTQKDKVASAKNWLKTAVSLVLVMGITWIIGILVFNRDLLFVAYIYTIFIGLQGLAIFILFVVLSKKVREAYTQWWKVKVASSDFLSRRFGEKSFSRTGLAAVGSTLNKSTLSTDKTKTRSMHMSPSPDLQLTDNGDIGTLHEEERNDSYLFNVTFIKGIASSGIAPIPLSDMGGGAAEEKEAEDLAVIIVNGSVLEQEEQQKQDVEENGSVLEQEEQQKQDVEENGDIESDSSEPEMTAL